MLRLLKIYLHLTVALKGGVVTPKEIVDAYINANRALFDAQKENFIKDLQAAKILGTSPEDFLYERMNRIVSGKEKEAF